MNSAALDPLEEENPAVPNLEDQSMENTVPQPPQHIHQGYLWSWVDFELGENVVNQDLEAKWAKTDVDGRRHVSDRETLLSHAPQFQLGIDYYRIVDWIGE